jgi:Raf kinase inhibitor-like YbhB/YbcL family protein
MDMMLRALVLSTAVLAAMPAMAMSLSSADFVEGGVMSAAQIYPRCGGENISPALTWNGAPAATQSFALTMIDRDVRPSEWSHWLVVDLPPATNALMRGEKMLPGGARAIASNFGDAAYDGPCPPKHSGTHHYVLTIWALPSANVDIAPDAKATDVRATLEGLALDHASLTATVTR